MFARAIRARCTVYMLSDSSTHVNRAEILCQITNQEVPLIRWLAAPAIPAAVAVHIFQRHNNFAYCVPLVLVNTFDHNSTTTSTVLFFTFIPTTTVPLSILQCCFVSQLRSVSPKTHWAASSLISQTPILAYIVIWIVYQLAPISLRPRWQLHRPCTTLCVLCPRGSLVDSVPGLLSRSLHLLCYLLSPSPSHHL